MAKAKRRQAAELNDRARKLQERGRLEQARAMYRKAAAADPAWGVPWYNLGLLCKEEKHWEESLECNQRATQLDADNDAAWWNLGIAATALGRWAVARAAWRGFGIKLPDGDGPIELPCGFCPIRLNPKGEAEVVWAERIDPARAVLESIPFPESGYRWQDVVLNDGAPNGYRKYQGREVPVFDALQLLKPSPFGTYVAQVALPAAPELVTRLAELAGEDGGSAEDWTTSIRLLCRACSEGRPHDLHDSDAAPPPGVHLIGIGAHSYERAQEILRAWEAAAPAVEVQTLEEALEPGPPE